MKKFRLIPIAATLAALLGLLVYSLERTIWIFQRFELAPEPEVAGAAVAAAIVVELSAVALIISAGALPERARPWSNRALLAVLSVQALANLSAGYLRGGQATLALFGTADEPSAYAVAAVLWLITNLAIPGLTLSLSKLLEQLIKSALETLPKRLETTEAAERQAAPLGQAVWQALPLAPLLAVEPERLELLDTLLSTDAPQAAVLEFPSVPLAPEQHRYPCPHCKRPLANKQAMGAAAKNGHCLGCKAERKAA